MYVHGIVLLGCMAKIVWCQNYVPDGVIVPIGKEIFTHLIRKTTTCTCCFIYD